MEQKSLFLENYTDNLPDSKFHVFTKVSSFALDSFKQHMLWNGANFKRWHHHFPMYFNTFLLATKDPKSDVRLIKNFIYIPTLTCTCNSSTSGSRAFLQRQFSNIYTNVPRSKNVVFQFVLIRLTSLDFQGGSYSLVDLL